MKLWSIALCLFIFGFAVSAVNDLGIFHATIPGPEQTAINSDEITDVSEEVMSTGLNPLFIFFSIQTIGKTLISGFIAILSILPLFCATLGAFGIPLLISIPIGMVIQGPIWFVMLNGLFQMITGYNEQGME
jgi:hypothetical protein